MKYFGNISYADIKLIEVKTNCNLPDDYKNFLMQTNGACTDGEVTTFFVPELNEDIPLDTIFGYNLERSFNLIDFYELLSDDLEKDMIPIGCDVFGGTILLVNQESAQGIYYWDDSLSFEHSTEECCVYKIANTFTEFIKLLNSMNIF